MIKNPSLLANLFSTSFLKKVIDNQHLPYLEVVLKETNFETKVNKSIPVSNALLDVFNYLNDSYRCEYVFKTAVLNELLLKRHDLYNSTYLTEFRAYNVKADILVLNGTSTVYEIKSDIDNFNRLLNQVSVYQKMFDRVFVVSNRNNINEIKKIVPKNIGIIILNSDLTTETIKEAGSNIKNLDRSLMFDSLRKAEYIPLIKEAFGYIPDVPGTLIHSYCGKLFFKLSNKDAHFHFLNALKKRQLSDAQIELINNVNISLKSVLSEKYYTEKECKSISFALNQNLPSHVSTLHKSKAARFKRNSIAK